MGCAVPEEAGTVRAAVTEIQGDIGMQHSRFGECADP